MVLTLFLSHAVLVIPDALDPQQDPVYRETTQSAGNILCLKTRSVTSYCCDG